MPHAEEEEHNEEEEEDEDKELVLTEEGRRMEQQEVVLDEWAPATRLRSIAAPPTRGCAKGGGGGCGAAKDEERADGGCGEEGLRHGGIRAATAGDTADICTADAAVASGGGAESARESGGI